VHSSNQTINRKMYIRHVILTPKHHIPSISNG